MTTILTRAALPAAACLLAGCLAACTKAEAPTTTAAATTAPTAPTAAAVPTALPPASAGGLAGKLCGVLRAQVPQVQGMSGIGARAQLVMAIAGAFDADATALGTVSSEIDAVAASGCPEVSAPLLAATRTATLQEAVR